MFWFVNYIDRSEYLYIICIIIIVSMLLIDMIFVYNYWYFFVCGDCVKWVFKLVY